MEEKLLIEEKDKEILKKLIRAIILDNPNDPDYIIDWLTQHLTFGKMKEVQV